MQCEEFEDRLNDVLDMRGRAECDPELHLHAETCPDCRRVAAEYDVLLDGFYALTGPAAPADMAARVLADLPARPLRARYATLAGAALATAAALLLVLIPLVRSWPRDDSQTAQRSAPRSLPGTVRLAQANVLRATVPLPLLTSLPSLAGHSQGDLYGELAKETGHGLAAIVLYVPGVGGMRGIIDADSSPQSEDPAWAVQVSEGLKPVTDSVTDTLNLLLRALPGTKLASRS